MQSANNNRTELENKYFQDKVNSIPNDNIREMINHRVLKAFMDSGNFDPDEKEIDYFTDRIIETLTFQYPQFRWLEVNAAFERGLNGELNTFRKLTVKIVLEWLKIISNQMVHNQNLNADAFKKEEDKKLKAPTFGSNNASRYTKMIRFGIAHDIPEDVYNSMTLEKFEAGEYDHYPLKSKDKFPLLKSF